MECSKCRVVKDASFFYATGRVCKECKREYARKYRGSRGSDAGTDDASVRTISDGILEALHRMQEEITELKEERYRVEFTGANLRQTLGTTLERVSSIEETLGRVCNELDEVRNRGASETRPLRVHVRSHPLIDLEAPDEGPAMKE